MTGFPPGGGGGGPDFPRCNKGGGGKENKNILHILLSFQLK